MERVSRACGVCRQGLAALQHQDGAAAGQAGGDRGAADAGADDDDIRSCVMARSADAAFSVAGSNNTALSRLKASGVLVPGWMSASARMRATTSLPPRLVTAKVSEPAGSTTSMWQSAVAMLRGVAVGAVRIGHRFRPDAEDDGLPWKADRPAGASAIGSVIGSRASRCSTTDSALPDRGDASPGSGSSPASP